MLLKCLLLVMMKLRSVVISHVIPAQILYTRFCSADSTPLSRMYNILFEALFFAKPRAGSGSCGILLE